MCLIVFLRVFQFLCHFVINLIMLWFIKFIKCSRFPRDPFVCVAMGQDCCIMSAICADVMVLVCNGACTVSLTLYDAYAPIFVFDAVYVCRNLAFQLEVECPLLVHRGGYVTARL